LHQLIRQIKKVVDLLFGYDQSVSLCNGIDIQKGNMIFGFGYLMTRNIAGNNFCENSGHSDRLQVTGYRLQVTGYRLQVTGYRKLGIASLIVKPNVINFEQLS